MIFGPTKDFQALLQKERIWLKKWKLSPIFLQHQLSVPNELVVNLITKLGTNPASILFQNFVLSFFYYILDTALNSVSERFEWLMAHSDLFHILYDIPSI